MKGETDSSATYLLEVGGELDDRHGYLFEGMQMTRKPGITVLTGTVRDRAHLYGVIERVEELGLELLSVQQTAAARPGRAAERRSE